MSELPPSLPDKQVEHLKLLSLFHYILGGVGLLFACLPLIHVFLGIAMLAAPESFASNNEPPPAFLGYLFAGLGAVFVLLGWTIAILTLISGRKIAQRKHRMFSIVVAAVLCLVMPFGTILGVFTIMLLTKEPVRRLYGEPA